MALYINLSLKYRGEIILLGVVALMMILFFGVGQIAFGAWEDELVYDIDSEKAVESGYEIYELMYGHFIFEMTPYICILEPDDTDTQRVFHSKNYKGAVTQAALTWSDGMNDFTKNLQTHDKGKAWDFKVKYYEMPNNKQTFDKMTLCTMFVVFVLENTDEDSIALATMQYDIPDTRHIYQIITIYTQTEAKDLTTYKFTYEDVRSLAAHELGHSMGLGHYYPGDFNKSNSIMFFKSPVGSNKVNMPPLDLDFYALYWKYGADGFRPWDIGHTVKYLIEPPQEVIDYIKIPKIKSIILD